MSKNQDFSHKNKRYLTWLQQAKYDLSAAKLSSNNGFFEWACFQSEQSAEKALKAVLVHASWKPPRMHKLSVLVSYCNHANERFNKTKLNFKDLESFTFISRYPFLIPGNHLSPHDYITKLDAHGCIVQADEMYTTVVKLLEDKDGVNAKGEKIVVRRVSRHEVAQRLEKVLAQIITAFNPSEVYLFGSYARNEQRPGSTIDLLIVAETSERLLDRIKKAVDVITDDYPPIEPLVYTKEELNKMLKFEGFMQSVMNESILLYKRGKHIRWMLGQR